MNEPGRSMSGMPISGGGLEEAYAPAEPAPRRERSRSDERFLLDLGELMRVSGSSSQLLYDVATLLAGHLGASRSLFSEIDRPNQRAIVHRDFHGELPSMAGPLPLESYSQENLAALRAGRVIVNCDTASDPRTAPRYAALYRPVGIRASVAVPLFLDGRWVSSLFVSSSEPRVWEAREVALVQSVAERTWMTFEHLRAVAALRRSEARKAAIVASALDAILSIDHRGQVLELNPAAERMFGRRGDDAIGRSLAELLELPPGPGGAPDLGRLLDVNGGMLGALVELPAIRADGSRFPAELAMAAVIGVTPPLFTATLRDITERKRSVEQFRLAVEASPTGMVMADSAGRLVLVNPEVERIFGYHRDELIGRSIDQLVPDPGPRAAGAGRDRRGMRKDGSLVAIEMTTSPMVTSKGVFALSSVVDVTQRKRLEAEREALVRELRELSRNLEVISSLLSLQAQHLADPVARAMFGESQGRVRSIALVHEKLYQARDLSHVRFDEYARELVEDLLHSLGGPGRSIDARLEVDDLDMAVTTAIPCGLILNELVTNSLKHAFPPPRGGTIRVGLRPRGDDRLELTVDDDGIGLPLELDPRRTPSLGLDLVFTFAQQLEAEVAVRRGDGTGFSFVFRRY